jgi:hypothetical protein
MIVYSSRFWENGDSAFNGSGSENFVARRQWHSGTDRQLKIGGVVAGQLMASSQYPHISSS